MAQYKTYETMVNKEDELSENVVDIREIKTLSERNNIVNQNRIVVVDNYADWCGPCKSSEPRVSLLCAKYNKPGLLSIVKENIEDKIGHHPSQIMGVPCFHFYVNGQFQDSLTITGADIDEVEKTIQKITRSN